MDKETLKPLETPSGKGARDENFPVGSFLLPKRLRPHVAKYYAFARAIDDIADNPDLNAAEKTRRLDGFAEALEGKRDDPGFEKAILLRDSLAATGVDPKHALDLVSAFKQDAFKLRYQTWDELMDYCNRSAAPVGRYLLELHGENKAAFRYSDALCNALQVINHLQDAKDDYQALDRVYLPQDWLAAHGGKTEELEGERSTLGLEKTKLQCIQETRELMTDARRLPRNLTSTALATESEIIVRIADKLLDKLEHHDPVAMRVELNKFQFLMCGIGGVISVFFSERG